MEPVGRPEYLRQQGELSLRRLGVERIDLLQLHRIDPKVPLDEQFGELAELQEEGKVRHIGLSEVTRRADRGGARAVDVVTVQNLYNLANRAPRTCSNTATAETSPSSRGSRSRPATRPSPAARWTRVAERLGATPAQVALAWLLQRSPVMLPIPGTLGRPPGGEHRGRELELEPATAEELDAAA